MASCPYCASDVDRNDLHCRSCGRSLPLNSKPPVIDRPIRDLPMLLVKGVGFAIVGLVILAFTMQDVGLLRPVLERTHQFIPLIDAPACTDVRMWYMDVEDDQAELDKQFELVMEKDQPSRADLDLTINALNQHRAFLIDSNPPDEALRLRGQYVESTDALISAMEALKMRDRQAAFDALDEGDRISALIDKETARINEKCGWDD